VNDKHEYRQVDNLTAGIHALIMDIDVEGSEAVDHILEALGSDINPYAWQTILSVELRRAAEEQFGTSRFEARMVNIAALCVEATKRSFIARDPEKAQEALDGEARSTVLIMHSDAEDDDE
jgi:hypothetical protein